MEASNIIDEERIQKDRKYYKRFQNTISLSELKKWNSSDYREVLSIGSLDPKYEWKRNTPRRKSHCYMQSQKSKYFCLPCAHYYSFESFNHFRDEALYWDTIVMWTCHPEFIVVIEFAAATATETSKKACSEIVAVRMESSLGIDFSRYLCFTLGSSRSSPR